MTPKQIGDLCGFVVAIADHYDSHGPSPAKTAEHYQLAHRARLLRAMVMHDFGVAWPWPTPDDLRIDAQLSQPIAPGVNHGS